MRLYKLDNVIFFNYASRENTTELLNVIRHKDEIDLGNSSNKFLWINCVTSLRYTKFFRRIL